MMFGSRQDWAGKFLRLALERETPQAKPKVSVGDSLARCVLVGDRKSVV